MPASSSSTPTQVVAKHRELTAAGLEPGEVQELTRGGVATTIFYCNAPGGILVEVSAHGALNQAKSRSIGSGIFVRSKASAQSLPSRCWIIMNVSNVYSDTCAQR